MNDTTLYGLCELARELNLPESTTRYYRDVFSPYVPSVGSGRRRRYPEKALTVLRFIADAFAVGRTRDEIREALTNGGAQQNPTVEGTEPAHEPFTASKRSDQVTASLIEGEREQRELMWQMIRELSRFGDAIERQHHILSELVDHVFHNADRQLPSVSSESSIENVVDADVVLDSEDDVEEISDNVSPVSQPDVEALRKALETERDLVNKLRQSKLELERRAASAESELENKHEQEPGLLRRLFERDRGR
jgi:DNA-binding transcriptional MerR regulator